MSVYAVLMLRKRQSIVHHSACKKAILELSLKTT